MRFAVAGDPERIGRQRDCGLGNGHMSLLSLLPFIGVHHRQGPALPDRNILPQAHGNDSIAGILGKPLFDFRH
jgi:hypothetical protein